MIKYLPAILLFTCCTKVSKDGVKVELPISGDDTAIFIVDSIFTPKSDSDNYYVELEEVIEETIPSSEFIDTVVTASLDSSKIVKMKKADLPDYDERTRGIIITQRKIDTLDYHLDSIKFLLKERLKKKRGDEY